MPGAALDTGSLLRAAQREFATETGSLKQRLDASAEALLQRSRQLTREFRQLSGQEGAARKRLAGWVSDLQKLHASLTVLGDVDTPLDELGAELAGVARRLAPRVSLLSR